MQVEQDLYTAEVLNLKVQILPSHTPTVFFGQMHPPQPLDLCPIEGQK